MKKLLFVFAFGATAFCANAQVKVLPSGSVGIGTNNSPGKLQIVGSGADFVFCPSGKTDKKSYFGTNNTGDGGTPWINFYHPAVGYNNVRFKRSIISSDSTLKTDIVPLEDVTDLLKQVKTYSYYYKSDCIDGRQKDYGVLAQELDDVLPDLVDTSMETMFVNYNAFIALLIKGFNEQQAVIEILQATIDQMQAETNQPQIEFGTLQQMVNQHQILINTQQERIDQQQAEISVLQQIVFGQELNLVELHELRNMVNDLRAMMLICCADRGGSNPPPTPNNNQNKIQQGAILYQNIPNPFSANTEISCDIPIVNSNAYIYVYNLQGVELKAFSVTQGYNTVTVYASELPAGMYLYTLVVDNEIIDTKRMILTK